MMAAESLSPLGVLGPTAPKPPAVTRSESIDKLAAALAKAQGTMKFAVKDAINPAFKTGTSSGSKYADLASVQEACREALVANELAVMQLPTADGRKVTLTTVLMHASGQFVSSELTMTAAQDTPQSIGSTITYARRYALAALAGVAQADDDGNAGSSK